MTLALIFYLIGFVESMSIFMTLLAILIFIGSIPFNIVFNLMAESNNKPLKLILFPFLIPFLLCSLIAVLLPSKDTAYTMLAAYGVEQVATNDRVLSFADNSMQVIEKKMQEYLKNE